MVSTMSSMSRWTSGERISSGGTGFATWRRTGWPRRATFRIAMVSPILARGYGVSTLPTWRTPSASRRASASKNFLNSSPCLNAIGVSSLSMAALNSGSFTAAPPLGVRDEVLRGRPRLVGGHDENRRVGGDERDRRELVHRESRRAAEELVGLGDDRDRREGEQERVAVGPARRHELHADRPGGARLVHDADRILQRLLHRGGDGTGRQVGDTARREGYHDRDRARRVRLLRARRARERCERGEQDEPQPTSASHRRSSFVPASASLARQSRLRVTSGLRPSRTSTAPTASSAPAIGRVTRIP